MFINTLEVKYAFFYNNNTFENTSFVRVSYIGSNVVYFCKDVYRNSIKTVEILNF